MAMSVAEQPVAEKTPSSPHVQLAFSSLVGAVYLLLSLWVFFAGFPLFWDEFLAPANPFLSTALMVICNLIVGVGLWYVGYRLDKNFARPGLRAGAFLGAVFLYLNLWLSISVIGAFLETRDLGAGGAMVTVAFALAMAFGTFMLLKAPAFGTYLQGLEDRGWFHALPYKPTQGVRVRRSTVLGILVVGGFGIITLVTHRTLGYGDSNNWEWRIPFTADVPDIKTDGLFLPLMFRVDLVMLLPLIAGLLWVAWRVVNWPTFADFLIATEAEMNKVSWTTRKRLVQDTIVVLVTVFLLTAYLFIIDWAWILVLTNPFFKVLNVDIKAAQKTLEKENKW
jgi:preprotein translocase SecE subunit